MPNEASLISMNSGLKSPRYRFLDNIKVLFTILVIYQHTMVTYVGAGWWYYMESNPIDPISNIIFMIVVALGGMFQASLMGLFFLLGGYFTPNSYDRKGGRKFWKERIIRLGIPLLLYIVLIGPLIIYILANLGIAPWSSDPRLQGSFLNYYISMFQSPENFINAITFHGPMWFLLVLLIFTAGYTLWRRIAKIDWVERRIPKDLSIPKYFYLLILAIGLGCLTFLVRIPFPIDVRPLGIPWGNLIQYIMMFSVGIICVRYEWFKKMTKKHVQIWLITIIASIFLVAAYFFLFLGFDADIYILSGGASVHALVFAVADNVICMGMIFVVLKVFYAKFNKQGPILQNLSRSAYNIYLVHAPVLVAISVAFASLSFYPIVKLGIVFPLTVIACYLLSHYVLQKIRFKTRPTKIDQTN